MKDQNTPTNTLEEKVRDIIFEYGSTNKSVNLGEAKSLIMELISEAVNKAYEKVNRFEVVDDTGRAYVKGLIYGSPVKVEAQLQDNDKTLKVFVTELSKTNTHMEGNDD